LSARRPSLEVGIARRSSEKLAGGDSRNSANAVLAVSIAFVLNALLGQQVAEIVGAPPIFSE
tara:strand:- start:254 stop:439 length:186 start_codon:yes stop_codon:yes gene_type:complete